MTFFDLLASIGKFFVNTLKSVDLLGEVIDWCSEVGVCGNNLILLYDKSIVGPLQILEVFQPEIWLNIDGRDKSSVQCSRFVKNLLEFAQKCSYLSKINKNSLIKQ